LNLVARQQSLLAAAALSCMLTGCVLGRRTITLDPPPINAAAAGRGAVFIGAIEDQRVFENQPKHPATPSIDGDITQVSKEQLGMMIGRQRNSYGRALGDIALPAGDSVVKRMRELLQVAFARRGYTISPEPNAPVAAGVAIREFWAWFTPGFWSVSFESRVGCTMAIARGGTTVNVTVEGYGKNSGQGASDGNWQESYQRAFEAFLTNFDQEMTKVGL
jgi:uncharacterized lipoprotein YajG